jgi:ribosome biogenesis GTPase
VASRVPSSYMSTDAYDREGLVLRVDRGVALVEPDDGSGPVRATWGGGILAAAASDPEAVPCTGDRVTWRRWPDGRDTLERIHRRRTLIARAEASGRTSARQPLAANVDVVAVVEALVPDPDERRVRRLLALAWASGAQPVVILTKADLEPEAATVAEWVAGSASCPVITLSVVTGEGVAEVRGLLAGGQVLALLGASGAGKSSLMNSLAGDELMRVRALRGDGKGRHTTVTRELHHVAGGHVIDSPGLRSVGLTGAEGLDEAFPDVAGLARGCHFGDCGHASEPGCAVLAAVERGELEPARLEDWRKLVAEGRRQELRRDARLRAEQHRQWRIRSRALRRGYTARP